MTISPLTLFVLILFAGLFVLVVATVTWSALGALYRVTATIADLSEDDDNARSS